eukprot:SM000196S05387  [mRNA]  locus=s196:84671:85577:- [translate_table: standard]
MKEPGARGEQPKASLSSSRQQSSLDVSPYINQPIFSETPIALLMSHIQAGIYNQLLQCVFAPEKTPSDRTVAQSFLSITLDTGLRLGGLATMPEQHLNEGLLAIKHAD